ncbi:hypothetical protein AMTRI_Chr13g122170 [Amborella trichopoda]
MGFPAFWLLIFTFFLDSMKVSNREIPRETTEKVVKRTWKVLDFLLYYNSKKVKSQNCHIPQNIVSVGKVAGHGYPHSATSTES